MRLARGTPPQPVGGELARDGVVLGCCNGAKGTHTPAIRSSASSWFPPKFRTIWERLQEWCANGTASPGTRRFRGVCAAGDTIELRETLARVALPSWHRKVAVAAWETRRVWSQHATQRQSAAKLLRQHCCYGEGSETKWLWAGAARVRHRHKIESRPIERWLREKGLHPKTRSL